MRSSMKKTTLREIKNSFGRWFAILAIVALGVGFFAGLMMTTPSMLQTGSDYINEKELYDLRLLSTLGFEKDAVELFEGNEDLEAVEGAVSSDFLAQTEDGESFVLMAQTLLDVQNQVVLVDGCRRRPMSAWPMPAPWGLRRAGRCMFRKKTRMRAGSFSHMTIMRSWGP